MSTRLRRAARWVLTQRWDFNIGYACGLIVGLRPPYWLAIAFTVAIVGALTSDRIEQGCRWLADRIDPPRQITFASLEWAISRRLRPEAVEDLKRAMRRLGGDV